MSAVTKSHVYINHKYCYHRRNLSHVFHSVKAPSVTDLLMPCTAKALWWNIPRAWSQGRVLRCPRRRGHLVYMKETMATPTPCFITECCGKDTVSLVHLPSHKYFITNMPLASSSTERLCSRLAKVVARSGLIVDVWLKRMLGGSVILSLIHDLDCRRLVLFSF